MHDDALPLYVAAMAVRGWGPRRLAQVVEAYGSLGAAVEASARRLPPPAELRAQDFWSLAPALRIKEALARCRDASNAGLSLTCWESPAYPRALREAPDAPPVLYLQGSLAPEALLPAREVRSAAVVGTRRASDRGMAFARACAAALAAADVTVVSGLAIGIDTAVHEGTVRAAGRTVAVLGGGHGNVHPPSNEGLARRILAAGGALLSEHPPDTLPVAYMFPRRNRIISGLCRLVAVIEAGTRSGASITAGHALDQGRDVYAAPGRPGDPKVAGTLRMLAAGAQILTAPEDLVEAFRRTDERHATHGADPVSKRGSRAPGGGGNRQGPPGPTNASPADPVLVAFTELDAPDLEELAQHAALPVATVLGRLTSLELSGRVRRGADGRYYLRKGP